MSSAALVLNTAIIAPSVAKKTQNRAANQSSIQKKQLPVSSEDERVAKRTSSRRLMSAASAADLSQKVATQISESNKKGFLKRSIEFIFNSIDKYVVKKIVAVFNKKLLDDIETGKNPLSDTIAKADLSKIANIKQRQAVEKLQTRLVDKSIHLSSDARAQLERAISSAAETGKLDTGSLPACCRISGLSGQDRDSINMTASRLREHCSGNDFGFAATVDSGNHTDSSKQTTALDKAIDSARKELLRLNSGKPSATIQIKLFDQLMADKGITRSLSNYVGEQGLDKTTELLAKLVSYELPQCANASHIGLYECKEFISDVTNKGIVPDMTSVSRLASKTDPLEKIANEHSLEIRKEAETVLGTAAQLQKISPELRAEVDATIDRLFDTSSKFPEIFTGTPLETTLEIARAIEAGSLDQFSAPYLTQEPEELAKAEPASLVVASGA